MDFFTRERGICGNKPTVMITLINLNTWLTNENNGQFKISSKTNANCNISDCVAAKCSVFCSLVLQRIYLTKSPAILELADKCASLKTKEKNVSQNIQRNIQPRLLTNQEQQAIESIAKRY